MILLAFLSFLVVAIYTTIITVSFEECPRSISEACYRYTNTKMFAGFMIAAAALLVPPALEASTEVSQFLVFLGFIATGIISMAPKHIKSEKMESVIHQNVSMLLFYVAQTWVALNMPWLLIAWIGYAVYILVKYRKTNPRLDMYDRLEYAKPVLWAEAITILQVYTTVLIGLF